MKFSITIPLLMILFVSCGGNAASNVNLVPGNYEVITKINVPGLNLPPQKTTQCFTKQELLPRGKTSDKCKVLEQDVNGNTISWKLLCNGSKMDGKITYSGETFKGTMQIETGARKVNLILLGKRIGNCKK